MSDKQEYALNLETCIRCTELSYDVAEGLGDILRAELAAMRAMERDAHALVRCFPAHRVWTKEEAALAASSAALTAIMGDPPVTADAPFQCPDCGAVLELLETEDDAGGPYRWTCEECSIEYPHCQFPVPPLNPDTEPPAAVQLAAFDVEDRGRP